MLQKIVVYTRLNEWDKLLIQNGIRLAISFGKELCLFHQVYKAYNPDFVDDELKKYRDQIQQDFPNLKVSLLIGSFRKRKMALHLADDHEAILMIAGSSAVNELTTALQESPIPFLFINEQIRTVPDFKKIVFPVDTRRQNRDALKWILYFGKYNQSEIIAIGANDKYPSNRDMVTGHLKALKTMLLKYNILHKIYRGTSNSLHVHFEGFDAAERLDAGMLVLLGSSVITLLDIIIGLPEEKIVKRAVYFAVLVINPKRETYLVCE